MDTCLTQISYAQPKISQRGAMNAQLPRHLRDERAAYDWVEAEIWPQGPRCPHCRSRYRAAKLRGASTQIGLYKCYACRTKFNVRHGTIFASSHVPLRLWLHAVALITGSRGKIRVGELHLELGLSRKTCRQMKQRILAAHEAGSFPVEGGNGGTADANGEDAELPPHFEADPPERKAPPRRTRARVLRPSGYRVRQKLGWYDLDAALGVLSSRPKGK